VSCLARWTTCMHHYQTASKHGKCHTLRVSTKYFFVSPLIFFMYEGQNQLNLHHSYTRHYLPTFQSHCYSVHGDMSTYTRHYLPTFQSHCYSVHGDMSTQNSCHSKKYCVFQISKVNVICMLREKLQLQNCESEFQKGITN